VANTVGGPTPQRFHRPAAHAAPVSRARHFHGDATVGRRHEQATARATPSLSQFEEVRSHLRSVERRLEHAKLQAAAPRRHFGAGSVQPAIIQVQPQVRTKPSRRALTLRDKLEHNLLRVSAVLFVIGSVGWGLLIVNQFRSPVAVSQAGTSITKADSEIGQSGPANTSSYMRTDEPRAAPSAGGSNFADGGEAPSSIVAREWARLEAPPERKIAERSRPPTKPATRDASAAKAAAKEAKLSVKPPPIRLASLDTAEPPVPVVPSRIPSNVGALTNLVDFETAPFPYHGTMPGSGRPFLSAGDENHRGHASFRGGVLWESQTFSDDRVLLHIPPGFDPSRPAVMVVFFHGHGANLARDVRDRQQVPAQITAAGVNAVLVAPQFAVNAADSSAGKFWEPNGFRRFLDEAATKLAYMYGDPRSAAAFSKMPIVLVSYSGGFGPTLSVLDHGGARSRIRGLVLLDSLYAGIDKFADWIADNRSTFFISSYTPHTAYHNADLERILRARSVPYGSELRNGHLEGMVTFLPAGPVSHRDFVTHAWSDNPIKDVLVRMDDVDPRIQTAATATTASIPAGPATRN
jgi:hypothetical protein